MVDLQKMSPQLNWDDLNQRAALPLGSWLKTDPWDDKVHMNAKVYAPMNARDKMPFEVTPIYYKLQRYDLAKVETPAPAPGAPPAAAPLTVTPQHSPLAERNQPLPRRRLQTTQHHPRHNREPVIRPRQPLQQPANTPTPQ